MERIKWLRKSKDMSQEALAERLGVQKAVVSKYERGLVTPSPEVLKKLSALFGVSIDYLLENDVTGQTVPFLLKDETQLIDRFRRMSDNARQTLLAVAHQMAPSS